MDKQTAAVDMPQKIVAEPCPLRRALNDAGDVGHDEGNALVDIHDAEIRKQSRKMIVRDLGMRLADNGKQRGFADIRKSDQTDVGQKLELERDVVALSRQAGLGEARDLARGRGEVDIAPASAAAFRGDPVLAGGHVVHDRAGLRVADDRSARDLNDERVAVAAVAAFSLPRHTVLSDIFALVTEVHQRGEVVVHRKDNTAAAAAVAAVRPARRDIFLAVESHGAVPAAAGADRDPGLINKRSCHSFSLKTC